MVLGLFGFLGKAVKGIGKVVGGAVKIGLGAAKLAGGLGLIPGGSLVGRLAGTLLAAKRPLSSPKIQSPMLNVPTLLRGKSPLLKIAGSILTRQQSGRPQVSTSRLQQLSPVLPGGAIATRSGPIAASGATPMSYSGSASKPRKRKRASTSRKRSTKRRGGKGRRLKFGSPAWRKKYLGHGRKKRRKRAA